MAFSFTASSTAAAAAAAVGGRGLSSLLKRGDNISLPLSSLPKQSGAFTGTEKTGRIGVAAAPACHSDSSPPLLQIYAVKFPGRFPETSGFTKPVEWLPKKSHTSRTQNRTVAASAGSSLSQLWTSYLLLLDTNPVPVKATTSMLLNLAGDLLCQTLIEKNEKVDWKRAAVIAAMGLLLIGPTLHFWYLALSRIVTAQGTVGALIQLALDQFVFSPLFIALFFAVLFTLEGRPGDIIPKLKQDLIPVTVTNWKFWIPFQFLNFRLVPLRLQVATANVIALLWTVYLSFTTHTAIAAPEENLAPAPATE